MKKKEASVEARWSENLSGIGRKIETYIRRQKILGDEAGAFYGPKISRLATLANNLAMKLAQAR